MNSGLSVSFTVPNGETAGAAGIEENGAIWMLCTPAIHKYPLTFAREAKRFIDSLGKCVCVLCVCVCR